ncbi:MAG: plasmid maintenance system antidote protein [Bacteroidia bacterium]|nr:plasmid maintenance system antidote protein [Bacteroidia bacterium]
MNSNLNILKGLHPGLVIERELKNRKLRKNSFALNLQEHPQTLTAITKGRRGITTSLALKIEKKLGFDEGFLMMLQVYFDIEVEKKKQIQNKPNLKLIRPVLFWDTKFENIDWIKQKKAVIKRVIERGNEDEKNEIIRYYGEASVKKIMITNEI